MNPVRNCPMPTPASTSRSGENAPPRRAISHTSAKVASAPAKAAPEVPSPSTPPVPSPSTSAPTAPSEAPEEIPSRYGSASGLRTSACTAVPTRPSPAPTTAASRARGSRSCHTIRSDVPGRGASPDSRRSTTDHTSRGGTSVDPHATENVSAASSTAPSTTARTPARTCRTPGALPGVWSGSVRAGELRFPASAIGVTVRPSPCPGTGWRRSAPPSRRSARRRWWSPRS